MTTNQIKGGFAYTVTTHLKESGLLVDTEHAKNRVPMEGLNDIVTTYLKGGAGPAGFYIGLWSGAHIPDGTETAANLGTLVTEFTDYSQTGRLALNLGAVSAGGCSNAGNLARFDMLATGTVNGAFLSTAQAKGASTGKLLSIVRFANPRAVDAAFYLEVILGFQFISL